MLWTKTGSLPYRWVVFEMCGYYGCTPSELYDQDIEDVIIDYNLLLLRRQLINRG